MFEDLVLGMNNICVDVFKTSTPIVFQRGNEQPISLEGIFDCNYQSADPESGVAIISNRPMLSIKESILPDGKVTNLDRITIAGIKYLVEDDQPDSGGMVKLFLQRTNL